jgi:hypothetical protein
VAAPTLGEYRRRGQAGAWNRHVVGVRMGVPDDTHRTDAGRNFSLASARPLMLIATGYDVQTAESGNSGLAQQSQQRSDVIITDILMPDGEGLETIGAL